MINLEQQKMKLDLEKEGSDLHKEQSNVLSKITLLELERIAATFRDFYKEKGSDFKITRSSVDSSPKIKQWEAIYAGQAIAELTVSYRDTIRNIKFEIYAKNRNTNSRHIYNIYAEYIVELSDSKKISVGGIKTTTLEEIRRQDALDDNDLLEQQRNKNAELSLTNSLLEQNGQYKFYTGTYDKRNYIGEWPTFVRNVLADLPE